MNPPRKRRSFPRLLGEYVEQVAKPALIQHGMAETKLLRHWEDIVGPSLAAHAAPHRVIHVSSPRRGEVGRGASGVRRFPIPHTLDFARKLRKEMTSAEQFMWELLRGERLGVKFRKQHPVGAYIVDFACLNPKLVIELDGGQHGEKKRMEKDEARSAFLREQGFTVLRFWNNELFKNTEGVLETIYNALPNSPHPTPPPAGEGVGDVLVIRTSGGFALEIQHSEPQILERIATYFGYRAIARLRIEQVAAAALPPKRNQSPADAAMQAQLRQLAKTILDD